VTASQLEPFARDDLASAETTVSAPVDRVYALLHDVERWPGWIPEVVAPIHHDPDSNVYRLTYLADAGSRVTELRPTLVGPTHRLSVEIVGRGVLHFRTRPHGDTTLLDARFEPVKRRTERIASGRRRTKRSMQLSRLLDLARRSAEGEASKSG
jgi:hypothetical protein